MEEREILKVIVDDEGYIKIGRFEFSPSCEFINFDKINLKKPNRQTQLLLRRLIPAYKRGFGLSQYLIKEFLYLDHYSANENQPATERIRDWICNDIRSRVFWGRGKLIESSKGEVRLNPNWIPPESAFY